MLFRQAAPFMRGRTGLAIRHFARRRPLGSIGAALILLVVVLAIFAPYVAPYDPSTIRPTERLLAPSPEFLFGTDRLGRDILSMVVFGSRLALLVGFGSSFVGSVVGGFFGLLGGYLGGKVDNAIQRLADILMSFPMIILALSMVAILGATLTNVIIAISIPIVPRVARVVRASVLAAKGQQYTEAALAVGCSNIRIMFVHILPNVTAPLLIILTAQLGGAILAEASLSFLGAGVPPPNFSWGAMLSGQASHYFEIAPWTAIFPGLAISLAVFAFNLFGDALRDSWDPKLRGA